VKAQHFGGNQRKKERLTVKGLQTPLNNRRWGGFKRLSLESGTNGKKVLEGVPGGLGHRVKGGERGNKKGVSRNQGLSVW